MESSKLGNDFEALFDDFVRHEKRGARLEDLFPKGLPDGIENADYVYQTDRVIVELKTLTKNHGDRETVVRLVDAGLEKQGLPIQRRDDWLSGKRPLPKKVERYVDQRVQRSLEQIVRKANSQIRSTNALLQKEFEGVLIVANMNETLFGPIELLKYLAGHALQRSTLAIDAILLITPGVQYSSGTSIPQHYVAPTYREGKEHLGEFLEPLVMSWLRFESDSLGSKLEVEIVKKIDEVSRNARPA